MKPCSSCLASRNFGDTSRPGRAKNSDRKSGVRAAYWADRPGKPFVSGEDGATCFSSGRGASLTEGCFEDFGLVFRLGQSEALRGLVEVPMRKIVN